MTNHIHDGSSLLQARNSHHHRHLHSHHHNHARFHELAEAKEEEEIVARFPNANLDARQADTTVQVVQTVSVVQVIDQTGGTVGVTTLTAPPAPTETQASTPTTAGISSEAVAASAYSSSLSEATASDGLPTSTSTATAVSGVSSSLTTMSTASASSILSSLTLSSLSSTLTSAPVIASSGFPSLTGAHNTTTSASSQSLFHNSTSSVSLLNTSLSSVSPIIWSSSTNSSSFVLSTTSFSWSSTSSDFASLSTSTGSASATESGNGGGTSGAGGAGGATATTTTSAAATSSTTASTSHGLSPETQGAVIGGVVGGLAGIALIIFAVMFLLKWKRQNMNGIRLGMDGEGSALTRGLPSPGGGPGGASGGGGSGAGGGGGGTAERSTPVSIPSSLAALSGVKRSSQPSTGGALETSERGFYRVSGKKLTSVLQSGGDGYADPHQSTVSGTSYRDSEAFFSGDPGTFGKIPLQLGSPMRPESGVPVIRSGPARTPVEEYGPFSPFSDEPPEPPENLSPPTRRDGLGRSLVSQDGSRGSRGSSSRFTENIA